LRVDATINGNSLLQIFDAANSKIECTPKSLVLNGIACRLSYIAFYMYRVGIYGLLIMTFGGG
jgi:hypothetical protein